MFEQKISVTAASFADFGQRWTRAMIKSEWKLKDGIEVIIDIEARDDMLSKTAIENNELVTACLNFIKAADLKRDGWVSYLSDCEAFNCCRLHGIKHTYPTHVEAISFKFSSILTLEDALTNLC